MNEVQDTAGAHMVRRAKMNATAGVNSTAALNATGTFRDTCSGACDSCFATHLTDCVATCYRGCYGKYHDCDTYLDAVPFAA